MSDERLILSIDLGTTSVKVALVGEQVGSLSGSWSRDTSAKCSGLPHDHDEQDVSMILSALQSCLDDISVEVKAKVVSVAITGQMHGVVLWKQGQSWIYDASTMKFEVGHKVSRLTTWQDGRCTTEFLKSLPRPNSHLGISTGFGCATLFWLTRHEPGYLELYDCAGTVQDYIVAMICNLDRPVMSSQNAASWGYFNAVENNWNVQV